MPRKKVNTCRKCMWWEKGKCYPNRVDWGMCCNKLVSASLAHANVLSTFEDFGCIHHEGKIFIKM